MNDISITIAIVYYKNLPYRFLKKSLYSALSQIGIKYKINLYLDNIQLDSDCFDSIVNIKSVPEKYYDKPYKIREFIVDDIDTSYVAFWDPDDIYTIDRLFTQYSKIKGDKLDLCFSNFSFFDNQKIYHQDFFNLIGWGKRKINIYDENYIGLGMLTAKKSYLSSLKPFPDVKTLDWWLAIKSALQNAKVGSCQEIHGYYRLYNRSLSNLLQCPQKKDFVFEKDNKLSLYKALLKESPEFLKRYEYYKLININENFYYLKNEFNTRTFKNIWGGLIQYVKG